MFCLSSLFTKLCVRFMKHYCMCKAVDGTVKSTVNVIKQEVASLNSQIPIHVIVCSEDHFNVCVLCKSNSKRYRQLNNVAS